MYLPWNPSFEKPGGHNAEGIYWTPPCDNRVVDISGDDVKDTSIPFIFKIPVVEDLACPFGITNASTIAEAACGNLLPFLDASGDCSGATCGPTLVNIYGAYMNIFDLSMGSGNPLVLPTCPREHFAFRLKDVLSTWLYLWESGYCVERKH